MPLTQAELEDIQAEAMADDIAIDFDKVRLSDGAEAWESNLLQA